MKFAYNSLTADSYNSLRGSVGWSRFPAAQAEKALSAGWLNVAAFADADGKPVAMGRVIGDGIYFLLVDVAVAPEHQKQGIGRNIVDAIIRQIRCVSSGNNSCSILLVSAQGKEEFYEKMGFSRIPDGKSGHGMRMLISGQEP